LVRVAERDKVAFADLLALMGPRVHGLSTKMVLDEQVGLEITQDVFLEIWQKAHTFDGALGNPDTWVTTIAFRRATDRFRSEDRAKGMKRLISSACTSGTMTTHRKRLWT